jgi:phosphoglycerate kinase
MEKELNFLGKVLTEPDRPFVAIIGGSKISGKIDVLDSFLGAGDAPAKADTLLIGGGMAYTFLNALGQATGKSLIEADKIEVATAALAKAKKKGVKLLLPIDHVLANKFDAKAKTQILSGTGAFPDDLMALDIGPATVDLFAKEIAEARTILWNGPMGVFELAPFAHGTNAIAELVAANPDATTIVGGGDSVAAVQQAGVADRITHISTGGGASLEFLEGKTLPGVSALTDK